MAPKQQKISISSICVFCGASSNVADIYKVAASTFGQILAKAGVDLVFGGGQIGLMGELADASIAHDGRVIGVIPKHLNDTEIAHQGLTQLHVVENMHKRKELMFRLSDAIVALPGGFGTLEEILEVITWRQLNLHNKPIIIVNVGGYWDSLISLLDHVGKSGFSQTSFSSITRVTNTVHDVLPILET